MRHITGNSLADWEEQEQREEERREKTLPCGCEKRCHCDDDDEGGL